MIGYWFRYLNPETNMTLSLSLYFFTINDINTLRQVVDDSLTLTDTHSAYLDTIQTIDIGLAISHSSYIGNVVSLIGIYFQTWS